MVNTILKMAKKRALVDGAIALARCSDIFTQDIEDIVDYETPATPANGKPDKNDIKNNLNGSKSAALSAVLKTIDSASSIDELVKIQADAAKLQSKEKAEARKAYSAKRDVLTQEPSHDSVTGEIVEDYDYGPPPMSAEDAALFKPESGSDG
jgi:hypothetical protein